MATFQVGIFIQTEWIVETDALTIFNNYLIEHLEHCDLENRGLTA